MSSGPLFVLHSPHRFAPRVHGLRATLVATLFALALTSAAGRAATAEPFALLAAAKGTVTVTSTKLGTGAQVSFGRELARGDKLAVGPGGSATIYFSDGNVVELGERSTLTIGGRAGSRPTAGPGAALPAGVYANVARFVTRGSRETGLVAQSTLRGSEAPPPMLLAPRRSDLIHDRPDFRWRPIEGATRYRVTVTGESGELWTRETREPALVYPADATALERDLDYLWRVDARSDAGSLHAEESVFHVVSEDIRKAVNVDLGQIEQSAGGEKRPATQFLAGSYLSGRGLYHDAAARFERLSRIVPESPAPHEALGNVYQAIGLMDRAAAEYQRALELTRSR
ncbi:MAG: hypothetical protein ABIS67_06330 [Candidatus Eisenbacteria bacterium]